MVVLCSMSFRGEKYRRKPRSSVTTRLGVCLKNHQNDQTHKSRDDDYQDRMVKQDETRKMYYYYYIMPDIPTTYYDIYSIEQATK